MSQALPSSLFLLAADLLLLLHAAFVAFVVFGLVLIVVGRLKGWDWIANPWFRTLHLAGIGVVVVQAWFGVICPLTHWEMALRTQAGDTVYTGAFIAHWVETLLYYDAPPWVFGVVYTAFGGVVVATWFWAPPRRFRS